VDAKKIDLIQRTLKNLAQSHASTIELMEQVLALFSEEKELDPISFWHSRKGVTNRNGLSKAFPIIDEQLLSVRYRDRLCHLGSKLPYRLFKRLLQRPNTYFTHDELLNDVWRGVRSSSAVRSAVKRLRSMLRKAKMPELADAIDGSIPGRYAFRLKK
jgi:DNA-binding response OmpR family regulator